MSPALGAYPDNGASPASTTPTRASERTSPDPLELGIRLGPEAIERISLRVAELLEARFAAAREPDDRWLDTRQAADYLGLSVTALHKLTAARRVPFSQDGPRARCWFLRSELDDWRRDGRR